MLFFLDFFFPPSFVGESSLFLLLFKLMLMSMGSIGVDGCSVVVVDVDDCVLVVVSVGVAMITVVESFVVFVWLVLFSVGAIDFFMGVFFPLFFLSLESTLLVFFVGVFLMIFDVFGGVLVVMISEAVVVVVVVVAVVVVF